MTQNDLLDTTIGPIIEHYLRRLDAYIQYLDDGSTRFLFVTRAGKRILDLYRSFLSSQGRLLSVNCRLFHASRMLVCKGISKRREDLAINIIGKEFQYAPLAETVKALVASNSILSHLLNSEDIPSQPLHEFIRSQHPIALKLKDYLNRQSDLFERYLRDIVRDAKRVVIIDSGWQGTAQSLLAQTYPEYEWIGLYFGWMSTDWDSGSCGRAYGLVFNAVSYDPDRPETAFTLHRHLIESLFEPNAPSIEELVEGKKNEIVGLNADAIENEVVDEHLDIHYLAALRHLQSGIVGYRAESFAAYKKAIELVARILSLPRSEEIYLFLGKDRSADFGRSLKVPVLRSIKGKETQHVQARIEQALWKEAQIVTEYGDTDARRILLGRLPKQRPLVNDTTLTIPYANKGRVAIITRTKDRGLLLRRAASSVANQTYKDYVWVVVNDGGNPAVVLDVLNQSSVPPHQIVFCDNISSVGMEEASNIGIRASRSEYIVIHDDDDSWHPDFLKTTVSFLDSDSGRKYGGVITHSTYVSEEISDNQVVEWGRWPYHDWVRHVHLSELAVENFFPPIAFLFRRSVCENIGMFDPTLPVLGDWDFAIRFLLKADIGVIPVQLAYYHHRDRGTTGAYSNSVIGSVEKHIEYNAIVRNKYIRESNKNFENAALAAIIAQGYKHRDTRLRLQTLAQNRPQNLSATYPQHDDGAIATSDYHWCLYQATLDYYSGIAGFFRRFYFTPNQPVLEKHIKKTKLSPPSNFDEEAYKSRYPDVAKAVSDGKCTSGYEHYMLYGKREGRIRPIRK